MCLFMFNWTSAEAQDNKYKMCPFFFARTCLIVADGVVVWLVKITEIHTSQMESHRIDDDWHWVSIWPLESVFKSFFMWEFLMGAHDKAEKFKFSCYFFLMRYVSDKRITCMYMHTHKTDNCVIFLRSIYILHIIQVFARVLFLFLRWRLWWVVLVAVTDTPRSPIECNQSNWEWWNGSGDNCERWQVAVVDGSNG